MKRRIIALFLAIPLLIFTLTACFTEPETPSPNESQGGLSAKAHYNDVATFLSKSKYVFFNSFGDEDCYDVLVEKENEKLAGTLEADYLENKYELDCEIVYTADGENIKELDASVIYADGYIYRSANEIGTLPLKSEYESVIELEALRALYGIRRLTYSAFHADIEKYYRIIETDDKQATVASISINGEDIKKHAEVTVADEKYGFDPESLELDCDISLKALPEDEGVTVTDFQIDSSLLYVANGKHCEFALHYDESSFDALLKVYSDSEKKEISSEYSIKAENGSGRLLLSGELRDMDTEGYANAPEEFKCRTLEVPFEYSEAKNPELNGYILTIERVRFIGEAEELNGNAATTADDGEFVFGADIDMQIGFVRIPNAHKLRVSGYYKGASFEIISSSGKEANVAVPEQYTESESDFIAELYESAPEFCERFGIMQESIDPVDIIELSDGYGSYIIDPMRKNGYYTTTFTMEAEGIRFADGRVLPLSYEQIMHDDENGIHTAVINGRNYSISSYNDYEGTLCQALECTDEIEGYGVTALVLYYPELEYGDIKIGFTAETDGEYYLLTFLDGYTERISAVFEEND